MIPSILASPIIQLGNPAFFLLLRPCEDILNFMNAPLQHDNSYIARQPILDHQGNIFAYELLFRSGPAGNHAGVIPDAMRATAQVLETTLNNMGLQKLVGNHKAFVNCSRDLLLSGMLSALDPKRFVLEILETVHIDESLVKAVAELHAAGYELAIDDFVFSAEDLRRVLPLFPYVKYVKVDLLDNKPRERAEAARLLKSKGKVMLAEKVEAEVDHRNCRLEGYELFQGYYFAKPEMLSSRKIDPRVAGIMQILQVLRKDPQISELETAFKQHPDLTLSLLRYLNSVSLGVRNPISSVRQAIALVGLHNLQQWLLLLLYARPEGAQTGASPLFENAAQRARFLEDLTRRSIPLGGLEDKAFLAGIMSRMDALCRAPMETILSEFDLGPEVSAALLRGEGPLGQMLLLVTALESGADSLVEESLRQLSIGQGDFQASLAESYTWSSEMSP